MKRTNNRSPSSRLSTAEVARLEQLLSPRQPIPDWSGIGSGSHRVLLFRCRNCRNEVQRPVRNVVSALRANRNPPCNHCYRWGGGISKEIARRNRLRIASNGSLAELYPEIAEEWDRTLNDLLPTDYAANSGYMAHWICRAGHRWRATINGRVKQRSGCRKCGHHISQYEKRVVTELQSLGIDVNWNERVAKVECDVLLRKQGLVIEVDGYPWHDSDHAYERERRKESILRKEGLVVLRWRCSRLRRRRPRSVSYFHERDNVQSLKRLFLLALAHGQWTKEESARIRNYCQSASGYLAEEAFQRLHRTTATQLFRQSVADAYPDLIGSWSSRNAPLTADQVSKGSKRKVWWTCSVNPDHEWESRPVDRCRFGCPHCNTRRATATDNFYHNHKSFCDAYVLMDASVALALSARKTFTSLHVRCVNGHRFKLSLSNLNDGRRSDSAKTFCCARCKAVMPYDGSRLIRDEPRASILKSWWDFERNRLDPFFLFPNQRDRYWWRCPHGHAFRRSLTQMYDTRAKFFCCPACGTAKRHPKISSTDRSRTSM
jgi:very-short-patch-repair endonuclease